MSVTSSLFSKLCSSTFRGIYTSTYTNYAPVMPSSICGWIEATDTLSYSGSGQTISSLVKTPADGTSQAANTATLGGTSGANTDDPAFVGTAGSSSAYFSLDGGDIFRLDATTLTSSSTLLNAQRTDAAYPTTMVWCGEIPEYNAGTFSLFGNHSSGTQVGVSLVINTDGSARLVIRGATATTVIMHAIPRGVPLCVIVGMNTFATTGNVRIWVNRVYKGEFDATAPASSSASTRSMNFCGANATQFVPNGSKFKTFAWFNELFDDAKANQVMDVLERKHGVSYRNQTPFIIAQGDSNTKYDAYNKDGTSSDYAFNQEGHLTFALAKMNYPARYPTNNNIAVVGDNTTQMLSRFGTDMSKIYGNVLVLLAGGNDVLQKVPPATTQSNLGSIIDKAVNSYGMKVVLCTQMPP